MTFVGYVGKVLLHLYSLILEKRFIKANNTLVKLHFVSLYLLFPASLVQLQASVTLTKSVLYHGVNITGFVTAPAIWRRPLQLSAAM